MGLDRHIPNKESWATVQVTLTSEVKAAGSEKLTAGHVQAWVNALPSDAQLEPLTRSSGDQRDPYQVFVGLKATWTETRGGRPGPTYRGDAAGSVTRNGGE